MNDYDEPLTGFSWNSNENKEGNSILIWNDIFFTKTNDRQEIAIAVMDTNDATGNNLELLKFVTKLSTVQIFSLTAKLEENNFNNLIDAIEEQRKLSTSLKPFQKFIFLIRDWVSMTTTGSYFKDLLYFYYLFK